MRIHILAGSRLQGFHNGFRALHNNMQSTSNVLNSVRGAMQRIIGGPGRLINALRPIERRINQEGGRITALDRANRRVNTFITNTQAADRRVASMIDVNQSRFFGRFPRLRPTSSRRPSFWQGLRGGVRNLVSAIGRGVRTVVNAVVDFYRRHSRVINIALGIIVGAVAVAGIIASGGTLLVPVLAKVGIKGKAAVAISKTISTTAAITQFTSTTLNAVGETTGLKNNPRFMPIKKAFNVASKITGLITLSSIKSMAGNKVAKKATAGLPSMKLSLAPLTSRLGLSAGTTQILSRTFSIAQDVNKISSVSLYSVDALASANSRTFNSIRTTVDGANDVIGSIKLFRT